ncbi:MAG: RdgB/HAM1 family non-canonical purine NTP pyrophosphatase [Acidobacteria bacterium]|nr:RdgB/HAM1 family non-canonical purine NTP pyrophosphatase [Acidobacteriota bacterium]MCZ6651134.1 RdgB/HAM1 family non-canonical purine NTP pyrophosphatase [Acidobacteriota bacterium]MCZ6832132.1 RdgB/HAM1 family non-canonical purine NTP pyrophosphatase [Acidobacteriota bacterium]
MPGSDHTESHGRHAPEHRLLLASSNPGKLREMQGLVADLPYRILLPGEDGFPLLPVEEDCATFAENAAKKALAAARAAAGPWVIADDSGLEVEALEGAPGVRSARFAGQEGEPAERDRANTLLLLQRLRGVPAERRQARFVCVLALADARGLLATVRGEVRGQILEAPQGTGGFGYDPVFFHPHSGRTFAQMTTDEKLAISHRGRALEDLRRFLGGR